MPYLITCTDKPDSAALRSATRAEHLAYIKPWTKRILAAGGFLNDAGEPGGGGMILLDTDDRAEAQAFADNDPYTRAGLFAAVDIRRWRKVVFNGELQS